MPRSVLGFLIISSTEALVAQKPSNIPVVYGERVN